jgi:SAM-dependent methyltransferase
MLDVARARERTVAAGKVGAEHYIWARVRAQAGFEAVRGFERPIPAQVPPSDVLRTRAEYEMSVAECRRLRLPLHHDRPKNWDALGAVSLVLRHTGTGARVLDAGAARYSPILPWLYLYGLRRLVGVNLEFSRIHTHGQVRYEPGDITVMEFADAGLDAITCMSVIEHGVPLEPFAREAARVLRPGGLLVLSTDYDKQPPDTTGLTAYGAPVRILGPADVEELVEIARAVGFRLLGELSLDHPTRPVHWKRTGLDFTFLRLAFVRS